MLKAPHIIELIAGIVFLLSGLRCVEVIGYPIVIVLDLVSPLNKREEPNLFLGIFTFEGSDTA
jgi:hypothetical protein